MLNNSFLLPSFDFENEIILEKPNPFIIANTVEMKLQEMQSRHIIPVFVKDNEPVISHQDFIQATLEVLSYVYKSSTPSTPMIRVSHPIKGRIPDAKDKPAKELEEHEKTLYYERMAFIIEIPTITDSINGNNLTLTVGGIKAYNLDNLYNRKGAEEHFKVFIGFQNKVCTNLCISTDGLKADLKVRSINELMKQMYQLFINYNLTNHLNEMSSMQDYYLSESQFASLIGRSRLYQHLPANFKRSLPLLQFGDNQIGIIAKDYYKDDSFCRAEDGSINIWKVFNLFTGANKQSYIDTFLDRGLNAYTFTKQLQSGLNHGRSHNWFLS